METAPSLNLSPRPPPELWKQVSMDLPGEFRDVSHHLLPDVSNLLQSKESCRVPFPPTVEQPRQPQVALAQQTKRCQQQKSALWGLLC